MKALIRELKAFAEVLQEHMGPAPKNFEQIVDEAIEDFKQKEKEAE